MMKCDGGLLVLRVDGGPVVESCLRILYFPSPKRELLLTNSESLSL